MFAFHNNIVSINDSSALMHTRCAFLLPLDVLLAVPEDRSCLYQTRGEANSQSRKIRPSKLIGYQAHAATARIEGAQMERPFGESRIIRDSRDNPGPQWSRGIQYSSSRPPSSRRSPRQRVEGGICRLCRSLPCQEGAKPRLFAWFCSDIGGDVASYMIYSVQGQGVTREKEYFLAHLRPPPLVRWTRSHASAAGSRKLSGLSQRVGPLFGFLKFLFPF